MTTQLILSLPITLSFSGFIIFASVIALSSASCEMKTYFSSCSYVIQCETTPSAISYPSCNSDPNVTFIMAHSTLNVLSTGFFSATNFDSKVREIKGVGNSWKTIDSSVFRYYPQCLRVDLAGNNILLVGAEAFRALNYMQYLNLSNNLIEIFHPKSFLISENRRNNLQELDLSHNKLQYLDTELNEVPYLRKLYLQNNYLSSIADHAFMSLKYLNNLYLQHNLLTSVNISLIHLKNVTELDISYNHLLKLSGYQINRLGSIVDFNASHNELTLVESNCFNLAFNLEKLDFSYNYINMVIENTMFENNNKLKYLNFYSNKLNGVQENAFLHCDLIYFNVENNNFTGDIKEYTFSNLDYITKLNLSQQNITGIRNDAFTSMESLLNLNLSRNNINLVENSSFASESNIVILDLSRNKIPDLYFVKNSLPNLTELYLNNNNITIVPKHVFDNQLQMRLLDLSMNSILSIEEHSLPLQNLQYLYVKGNQINGVIKSNIFSPAKFLRFLELSHFNISKIDSMAFVDLPVLAKLNLSNNYISSIEPDSFKNVNNLYSLDISHNNLVDLTFTGGVLNNLKALHISNNNLTDISSLLSNTCKLSYLDLSFNNIRNVSEMNAVSLPNLTVLFLDNNKLQYFNSPTVNTLSSLIDLGLSSNEIKDIQLNYFKELMSVDLSNNGMTFINRTFLENNDHLQALDLSRNQITELPPGTFQFMKNLKMLNLSSNYLNKLRYGSLKGLSRTEILDLSRNNIAQLDVDIFHECGELKVLIIDYNRIKTFDVERLILIALRKLRTLSLGGNPILCREIVHNMKSANTTFYAIRQVEVTSIDKIYHEDNVHGIKCGDDSDNIISSTKRSITVEPDNPRVDSSFTSTSVVLIWCLVLTIILVAAGVIAYIKLYNKKVYVVDSNMNLQFRNSMDLTGSDFQNDLLS